MTATYDCIATTTTASSAASVTFSSIPSTYTDLFCVMNFSLSGNNEVLFNFNGDTAANYSRTYFEGNGSTASSARQSSTNHIFMLGRSSQMVNLVSINNYSNSTTYKTLLARFSSGQGIVGAEVGLWRSTAAINQIVISLNTGTFTNGSVISLYGIKAE